MNKFFNRLKIPRLPDHEQSSTIGSFAAIGLLLGIVVGAVADNVGLWLSLGLCLGVATGVSLSEEKPADSGDSSETGKNSDRTG